MSVINIDKMKGEKQMDKEMMSCEELKEEIIRIIQEIDNVEVLEEIYHIVKKLLKMELAEE